MDFGLNVPVVYSISANSFDDLFEINANDGTLMLRKKLTNYDKSDYNLIVAATQIDNNSKTAMAMININVIDENKYAPEFLNKTLEINLSRNETLTLSTTKNASKTIVICEVHAFDRDNNRIEYSLVNSYGGLFKIKNKYKGIIWLTGELESRQTYKLEVQAFDGLFTDSSFVYVNLLMDENHPAQQLVFEKEKYNFSIDLSKEIGIVFVGQVKARYHHHHQDQSSEDTASSSIVYSLQFKNENDSKLFCITQIGIIYLCYIENYMLTNTHEAKNNDLDPMMMVMRRKNLLFMKADNQNVALLNKLEYNFYVVANLTRKEGGGKPISSSRVECNVLIRDFKPPIKMMIESTTTTHNWQLLNLTASNYTNTEKNFDDDDDNKLISYKMNKSTRDISKNQMLIYIFIGSLCVIIAILILIAFFLILYKCDQTRDLFSKLSQRRRRRRRRGSSKMSSEIFHNINNKSQEVNSNFLYFCQSPPPPPPSNQNQNVSSTSSSSSNDKNSDSKQQHQHQLCSFQNSNFKTSLEILQQSVEKKEEVNNGGGRYVADVNFICNSSNSINDFSTCNHFNATMSNDSLALYKEPYIRPIKCGEENKKMVSELLNINLVNHNNNKKNNNNTSSFNCNSFKSTNDQHSSSVVLVSPIVTSSSSETSSSSSYESNSSLCDSSQIYSSTMSTGSTTMGHFRNVLSSNQHKRNQTDSDEKVIINTTNIIRKNDDNLVFISKFRELQQQHENNKKKRNKKSSPNKNKKNPDDSCLSYIWSIEPHHHHSQHHHNRFDSRRNDERSTGMFRFVPKKDGDEEVLNIVFNNQEPLSFHSETNFLNDCVKSEKLSIYEDLFTSNLVDPLIHRNEKSNFFYFYNNNNNNNGDKNHHLEMFQAPHEFRDTQKDSSMDTLFVHESNSTINSSRSDNNNIYTNNTKNENNNLTITTLNIINIDKNDQLNSNGDIKEAEKVERTIINSSCLPSSISSISSSPISSTSVCQSDFNNYQNNNSINMLNQTSSDDAYKSSLTYHLNDQRGLLLDPKEETTLTTYYHHHHHLQRPPRLPDQEMMMYPNRSSAVAADNNLIDYMNRLKSNSDNNNSASYGSSSSSSSSTSSTSSSTTMDSYNSITVTDSSDAPKLILNAVTNNNNNNKSNNLKKDSRIRSIKKKLGFVET